MKTYPSQAELKRLFTYDYKTGELRNRIARRRAKLGALAGNSCNGYLQLCINYKMYRVHRLIWIMVYGKINPNQDIDHINGKRDDNRLCNLRLVTAKENRQNNKAALGVSWHCTKKCYIARIGVNGKNIYLGYFRKLDDAIAERKQAENRHGFHPNHGSANISRLPKGSAAMDKR